MKKYLSILFALVLAVSLMLVPAVVSAQPKKGVSWVLWGVTGVNFATATEYSEVFKVNTATGVVTMVNNNPLNPLYSDIAVTPNGRVYAIGRNDLTTNFCDFFRLNPADGSFTATWDSFVPMTSAGGYHVNALCAEDNHHLLAIEGGGVAPGKTDPISGIPYGRNPAVLRITLDAHGNFISVVVVGILPVADSDGDLDRDPSSGKWYAGFWTPAGSAMWEIDIANPSASTLISPSNIKWQGGFAFRFDGTAYAGSWADKNLYTVNVLTGGSSVAYDLSPAFAPGTWGIFGLSSRIKPMTGGR